MEIQTKEETGLSNESLKAVSLNSSFEIRSEIVQEIIKRKPDFIEKWSLLVFVLLLLGVLAGTWFIRYPDIIVGGAVLTSENAPKEIVSKQGGKLIALRVQNNQYVKNGEILGWLESNASTQEIIDLSEQLKKSILLLNSPDSLSIPDLFHSRYDHLGELQTAYQIFIIAVQQYNDYMINGFYKKKKSLLFDDIESLDKIKTTTETQRRLTQKDSELAKKSFDMNERLYKEKVISTEEYRQAQSKLLTNLKELPRTDATIISQQSQIREKEKEINQLNHDILQQSVIFEQALYTLKSNVDEWLKRYTILAPTDGQIVFVFPLQQNQYIEQGKLLGYVNPSENKYYAELNLSQKSFGKIDTGMKVQLRFDAYPYQEIGFISGRINYISSIAIDSGFTGTIKLENGLITNQNKTIHFKNGLKGQAIIITKDMNLLERLYYSVVKSTSLNN